MVDANQKWGVDEAIARISELAELDPGGWKSPPAPTTFSATRASAPR